MAGVSAARRNIQGQTSAFSFGVSLFWQVMTRYLYNKDILKYYISDCTHWKTIANTGKWINLANLKYGDKFYIHSSTFDVNEYVQTLDNKQDFMIDPNIERLMCMYLMDFSVPKSRNVSWKSEMNTYITHKSKL